MSMRRAKNAETRGGIRVVGGILVVAALGLVPAQSHAFSGESAVRDGCHEHITFLAIENARWPGDAIPPVASGDDLRVINDVPFTLPSSHRNIWSVTVVLGNREVDLGGFEPDDLPELSHHHADPDLQASHCLRSPSQDGVQGDIEALAQCRGFIMGEIEAALGTGDEVDLNARERQPVFLVFRESLEVSLPRYHYHLGRALHALQDGFSHAFRDPENLTQVRSVLNYADFVGDANYDPAVDGHEHVSYLDACFGVDDLQDRRVLMAAEASAMLMEALADPTGGRAGRIARAEEVLVRYLSMDPDVGEMECTEANGWCNAPEPALSDAWEAQQGCSVSGAGMRSGGGIAGLVAMLLVAVGAVIGRRRRRGLRFAVALAAAAVLTWVSPAAADDPEQLSEARQDQAAEAGAAAESRIEERVAATGAPEGDPIQGGFGMYFFGRGSLQEAGVAAGLGARYDLGEHLTIGLDVEYNPWLNIIAGGQSSSAGTINAFGTGILKWDVEDYFELRTTVHLGISYMLDDLIDAPSGSVGPFLGIAPVGVAFRASGNVRIVLDPGVMIAIPSMKGVPLARVQYGLLLGVQWNP